MHSIWGRIHHINQKQQTLLQHFYNSGGTSELGPCQITQLDALLCACLADANMHTFQGTNLLHKLLCGTVITVNLIFTCLTFQIASMVNAMYHQCKHGKLGRFVASHLEKQGIVPFQNMYRVDSNESLSILSQSYNGKALITD